MSESNTGRRSYIQVCVVLLLWFSDCARCESLGEGVTLTALTQDSKSSAIGWAPHGNKIAYVVRQTETQRQLFIADSDGSNAEAISSIGNPYYAEWSWAGEKLAFLYANSSDDNSEARAYVYDLKTKKLVSASAPYPRSSLDEDEGPVWSADDRCIAFKTRRGPSQTRFVTVYDTQTKSQWDVVPERGQNRHARWSPTVPSRLAFLTQASGEYFNVAVAKPDGSELVLLTSIGAESVSNGPPCWRPPGGYEPMIAYISNLEMTRTERDLGRNDVWIAHPDGTASRNLTKATSPSTERQLNTDFLLWSWDGRWILSRGDRFDAQGRDIHTAYLVDPVSGGYKAIFTTYPQKDGVDERVQTIKWSYDSKIILLYSQRYDVRNWSTTREYQRTRHVISLLHVDTGRRDEILLIDEEQERKKILGSDDRGMVENISFSPDGRSILLSIAEIISREDRVNRPDVYRLDLPDSLVGSEASKHIGPPTGRSAAPVPEQRVVAEKPRAPEQSPAAVSGDTVVTETICPLHMTAEEAMGSLSPKFTPYFTKNAARNLLLFKGPRAILDEIRQDLAKIDTEPPQILVDLLAVELAEEANRSLGLDWTYANGRFAAFQPTGNAVRNLTPEGSLNGITTYPGTGQVFYQGVGKLPQEFFVRLNALVQNGKGTILANPRTVAMSGRESQIQIRKTLNYFFNEGFDVAGRPVVKKSDISSDTVGRITPTLLADGKIHMMVDVKVGSFTFTSDAGLPEQTQRDSTTEVAVSEGDTLVIGGLRQQEMVQTVSKVPLLGDLPILGWLFKKKQKDVKKSVLTLFITPHVLREGGPTPAWPQVDLEDGHRIVAPDPNESKS
jgi:type II secretory pathway component GspD/PulD (secretin)